MVREMIAQMLGGYGNGLLVFVTSNPALLAAFLCVWFAVIFAGNLQLRRIESETVRYVVRESTRVMADNPRLSAKQLCQILYPGWVSEMRHWGWFVSHRWELWPVPVRPETVQRHFQFTAAWLKGVLRESGAANPEDSDEHDPASRA